MNLLSRREALVAGAAGLSLPNALKANAPASRVALERCRSDGDFGAQLSSAFDHIGWPQTNLLL